MIISNNKTNFIHKNIDYCKVVLFVAGSYDGKSLLLFNEISDNYDAVKNNYTKLKDVLFKIKM